MGLAHLINPFSTFGVEKLVNSARMSKAIDDEPMGVYPVSLDIE